MKSEELFPIIIFPEVRIVLHSGVRCFPTFGTFGSEVLLFPISKVDVHEILYVGERLQEVSGTASVKWDSYPEAPIFYFNRNIRF